MNRRYIVGEYIKLNCDFIEKYIIILAKFPGFYEMDKKFLEHNYNDIS